MNVLNIFTDLGDDVKLVNDKHISSIDVKDENDNVINPTSEGLCFLKTT